MAKDIDPSTSQGAAFAAADPMSKAKFAINDIVGRITGINVFPSSDAPQFTQTINPAGVLNKTTGFGLGLLIYNKIGSRAGLPKIVSDRVAKEILKGGAIGGFFDAPSAGVSNFAIPSNSNSGSGNTGLSAGGLD
jgi:hypothetical protein